MGSRREQVYITESSIFTSSVNHSGVRRVNVSLGSFAQYLKIVLRLLTKVI